MSDIEANSHHAAHISGLAAILNSKSSPFNFTTARDLFQLHDPLALKRPLEVRGRDFFKVNTT